MGGASLYPLMEGEARAIWKRATRVMKKRLFPSKISLASGYIPGCETFATYVNFIVILIQLDIVERRVWKR